MTVTTPLLIQSTEDEEDEDDLSKARNEKEEIKYKSHNRCFDFAKFTTAKVKGTFIDRKHNFDIQYIFKNRKYVIVFMVLVFTICYLNTGDWNDNEKITVIHHSHVPGMKDNNLANEDEVTASSHQTEELSSPEVTSETSITETTISRNQTTITLDLDYTIQEELLFTPSPPPPGYLVWSDSCQIIAPDIYEASTMKYFKRQKYEDCISKKPMTNISFDQKTQKYVISIDEDVTSSKPGLPLECCYHEVERVNSGKTPDNHVKTGSCLSIGKAVQLPNTTENVIVKCQSAKKQIYVNGYPTMPERSDIRKRLKKWEEANKSGKPLSVLMLGIDSISRLNFIRAMPKTAQYVYDNEWFEMSGYNKMGDNTYPNLMAILTGYNSSRAFDECAPRVKGKLDRCPFIWKKFRDQGYVTAYAEDEAQISTFNYLKVGFEKPPVDYYLRPFLLQAEKNLPIKKKSGMTFCLGYKHASEYVFDYAVELSSRYKGYPYFGFFWANSFSHQSVSDPSSMDTKILEYLQNFSNSGVLNDSIVFFFSDHGMRFGPTRATSLGHYEERLPFMFIWLPTWVKETYPEFVTALTVNKNQLTNPYDIHMTLQHILQLAKEDVDPTEKLPQSDGCPKCQTLLKPVSFNRSCEDISIEDHWCTCLSYDDMKVTDKISKKIGKAVIDYINDYVATFSFASHCKTLSLGTIKYLQKARKSGSSAPNSTSATYRITFYTLPNKGLFEATVRHNPKEKPEMTITGEISRLNVYASDSRCVSDGAAKKYCSCKTGNNRRTK